MVFFQAENLAKKQQELIEKEKKAAIQRDRERNRLLLSNSDSVRSLLLKMYIEVFFRQDQSDTNNQRATPPVAAQPPKVTQVPTPSSARELVC